MPEGGFLMDYCHLPALYAGWGSRKSQEIGKGVPLVCLMVCLDKVLVHCLHRCAKSLLQYALLEKTGSRDQLFAMGW